jgi:hypothetical protein
MKVVAKPLSVAALAGAYGWYFQRRPARRPGTMASRLATADRSTSAGRDRQIVVAVARADEALRRACLQALLLDQPDHALAADGFVVVLKEIPVHARAAASGSPQTTRAPAP